MYDRRHGGGNKGPRTISNRASGSVAGQSSHLSSLCTLYVAIPELGTFPWLCTRCLVLLTFMCNTTLGLVMSNTPARWNWICLVACGIPLRGRIDRAPWVLFEVGARGTPAAVLMASVPKADSTRHAACHPASTEFPDATHNQVECYGKPSPSGEALANVERAWLA